MKKTENKHLRLSELPIGKKAVLRDVGLSSSARRRLYDIGMNPGSAVICLGRSPLGDPAAYLARDRIIAIRGRDAEKILCDLWEF